MDFSEKLAYETEKRFEWWIRGRFVHCIPGSHLKFMTTELICELYNVEMHYFRPWKELPEFETILDVFKDYYEKAQEKNNAAANKKEA